MLILNFGGQTSCDVFFLNALVFHWLRRVSGQNAALQDRSMKQLSLCSIFSRHQVDIWIHYFGAREIVLGNRVVTGSYIKQSWGLCVSANCLLIISHSELMQRK